MAAASELAAFLGVGLAAAGYLPQILHLSRERCAAGISKTAFCIWFLAALLITSHAVATGAMAFIALGVVQIIATAVVLAYATRYASSYCAGHEPWPTTVDGGVSAVGESHPSEASQVTEDIAPQIPKLRRSEWRLRPKRAVARP